MNLWEILTALQKRGENQRHSTFGWINFIFSLTLILNFSLWSEGPVMDQKVKQMMKQQQWLWLLILVGLIGLLQKVPSSFKRLDLEWLFNSWRLRKDCVRVELSSVNMVCQVVCIIIIIIFNYVLICCLFVRGVWNIIREIVLWYSLDLSRSIISIS